MLIIECWGGLIIALKNLFDSYKEFEEIMLKKKNDVELTPTLKLLSLGFTQFKNDDIELIKLPGSKEDQQDMNLIERIVENLDSGYGGGFVLRHILSELTYNIHEHAFEANQKTQACLAIMEHLDEEKLEISIRDCGLSIPGRFDKADVHYGDDCSAIEKAINNFSTASDNPYERGNGLWTTIRLIVEGNGGEVLIVSRGAVLYINEEKYEYKSLNDGKLFKGTLISIKLNRCEVQNIYDLIELPKNNFYRYGG